MMPKQKVSGREIKINTLLRDRGIQVHELEHREKTKGGAFRCATLPLRRDTLSG